jgi:hypothetical protein
VLSVLKWHREERKKKETSEGKKNNTLSSLWKCCVAFLKEEHKRKKGTKKDGLLFFCGEDGVAGVRGNGISRREAKNHGSSLSRTTVQRGFVPHSS